MSKHSPGPWKVDAERGGAHYVDVVDAEANRVAVGVFAENAPLVAAAPELAETLAERARVAHGTACPSGGAVRFEHCTNAPCSKARALLARIDGET